MTQEFQISVTPVGVDEYLVRTERVAPGVPLAEEQAVWQVDGWIGRARDLMSDPLSGLLQGKSPTPLDRDRPDLVTLGQQLYNALFQGSLRDSWMMAQGIAQNRQEPLRLRLGLKGTRLPSLPWEVLHDGDYPLATGTSVLFSRYLPGTNGKELRSALGNAAITPQLPPDRPLRILMAVAAPSDRDKLQLTREAEDLQTELKRLSDTGQSPLQTEVEILEQPSRSQLTQALEHGHYQILHYAGHSNSGESGGSVYLVNPNTGVTETLSGDDLAGLLANNGIQMVLFNSCRGAHVRATGERNLASALVKRGIPAVLAMAERIPDEVALTLTRLFYRNLMRGCPIDLSVSRARQGLISAYGSNQLYWALPIFYLHPQFDGYLTSAPHVENPVENAAEEVPVWPSPARSQDTASTLPNPSSADSSNLTTPLLRHATDDDDRLEGELGELAYGDMTDDADAADLVGEIFSELAKSPPSDEPPSVATPTDSPASKSISSDPSSPSAGDRRSDAGLPTSLAPSDRVPPFREKPFPQSQTPQQVGDRPLARKKVGYAIAIALVAIVGVGVWWSRSRSPSDLSRGNVPIVVVPQAPSPPSTPEAWQDLPTPELTSLAMAEFAEGNFDSGIEAVAALLKSDRNALDQARAALAQVPSERLDDPKILFLKGRLAWQFVQAGNEDYSFDDARRSWEAAVRRDRDSLLYRTALGFVYYAEEDWDAAYETWLEIVQTVDSNPMTNEPTLAGMSSETLTLNVYAGLALSLARASETVNPDRRDDLVRKAIQLRQLVLKQDASQFQPSALSRNWLWTPEAIGDWSDVLALES
ncbi:heterocyst differentiation protein [Geitlerinema sp. FC II]|nr:CHAT domain-containing protein [Geitlerinema sp. CS-897]PPT06507.1 heterocyst differentiation protein [Geitlerinema sp. FC II]